MAEKNMYSEDNKILSVKNLQINFKSDSGIVHAVRGVSFDLYKGETLCIVGESGSGKSVTSKTIMGILPKNAIISNGQILYEGEDLVRVSEEDFHRIRGNKIGMIFQDPLSALNPLVKVGKQITETSLINSNILKKKYYDLISGDLTAVRNNEANAVYETNRTKGKVYEAKKNLKEYLSYKKKLDSLKNTNSNKLEEVNEKVSKLSEKLKSYVDTVKYSFEFDKEYYESEIKKFKTTKVVESSNSLKNELVKTKIENRIESCNSIVKLVDLYKNNPVFVSDDLESETRLAIEYSETFMKVIEKNCKHEEPVLKKILKISKKEAKVEVSEYKANLIKEHNEQIAELLKKKKELIEEFEKYKLSLPAQEVLRIEEIVLQNKKLEKKQKKTENLLKQNSISKVTKKEEFKKLGDAKYEEYIENIKKADDDIKKADEDFINKTKVTKKEAKKKALEVMREVGIPLPERRFKQYPFEFSGGMRQRIVIAIALTADPEILICDEPTTALDVTIQAQILELINKLKKERNLSCIFITHDLGVVANMADRVAVMYAGKIVEYGLSSEVFFNPKHPYTWALLSSIPDVDSKEKLEAIPGTPPDMVYPPKGDAFALRSKYAMAIDFKYQPPYFKVSDTHYAATWLLYPGAPKVEMPAIVKTRIKNALESEKERVGLEELKKEVTCYDQIK